MLIEALVAAVLGYLIGAIPFGLIIGKRLKGIDVREYGSGSIGFTNSLRTMGLAPALLVAVLDISKGAAAVLFAGYLFEGGQLARATAGAGAVVGHVWPVYVGFKGGRGVATGFGALLALVPPAALAVVPVGVVVAVVSRYMSLMSLIGTCLAALIVLALALLRYTSYASMLYGILTAALIIYEHRGNIKRLRSGTEPKIGQGGIRRVARGAGRSQ